MNALISECKSYRYWLTRSIEQAGGALNQGTLLILMLNPSTADAFHDDNTIRKVMGFARSWGYTEIVVINLYAFRSPHPSDLWNVEDPVGTDNDKHLAQLLARHKTVLCAWGANAPIARAKDVCNLIKDLGGKMICLGLTKNGSPRHPLYIRNSTLPIPYIPV